VGRALLALALCSTGPAFALSTVLIKASAGTDLEIAPFRQYFDSAEGTVSGSLIQHLGDTTSPDAYALGLVSAAANEGSMAISAYTRVEGRFNKTAVSFNPVSSVVEATTRFRLTDVIFSGPGPTVSAALRLDLSGSLGASAEARIANTHVDGGATLTVNRQINNGAQHIGQRSYASQASFGEPGTNGIAVDNGPLAGVSLPGTITFNPVLVLTNTPVTIEVVMFVSAGASMRNFLNVGDGRAVGVGQFGSTAALPSTTPVFDLPTGYSARSLSANIVDNHWLGTAVAVSPVPEPAPVILFTAGCLVLGLRHKFVHRVRPVRPDATRSV
jgi:hypothetical protein